MPYPQYHPVYLDLNGRSVLVVGGGAVALEKLHSLLPASGARITVVSPEARAEIRAWHEEGKLVWEARAFVPSDVEAFFMVIAATDDPGLNALVYRTGNERNKLSNSVDDPVNCNFIMSAIARQGPMQVAVSSAGCSPALAQRVRSRISNEILTEELGALAEFLGDRRDEVKRRLPGYKVRQAFWEGVIDSPIPDLLKDGKDAEGEFRRRLERAVQSASPGLKGPDDAAQNLGTGSSFQGGEVALSPGGRGAGVRGSKEVGLRFGTPWKDRFRGVSLPFPTPSADPLTLPSPARGEGYPIDSGLGHAEIDAISTSMPTEGEGYLGPFVATSDLSAADGFKPGKVSIVGAGPGDPELLTLKAVRALQRAQVVLYDRLVSPEVLEYVPARAERIYVGKEVGHKGKGRQRWIEETMVARARAGKAVVRLKGGDPFVFGRGGEEVLALKEAGIEFEVVPGVSSAIAGPAAAGIPVTHRGVSTSFAVFTGHEAEGRDDVPWDAAARIPTAVFLMGVERLPRIVERLMERGRNPETPVAVVSKATHRDQRVATGTLRDIARRAKDLPAPAVIVVGEVVNVAHSLTRVIEDALIAS